MLNVCKAQQKFDRESCAGLCISCCVIHENMTGNGPCRSSLQRLKEKRVDVIACLMAIEGGNKGDLITVGKK